MSVASHSWQLSLLRDRWSSRQIASGLAAVILVDCAVMSVSLGLKDSSSTIVSPYLGQLPRARPCRPFPKAVGSGD